MFPLPDEPGIFGEDRRTLAPEIATWMEENGFPVDPIPEHFSGCSRIVAGEGPVIHSPGENAEYKIRPSVSLAYQKILLDASVTNQTKTIYWFVNGKLVFSGDPTEQVFITPTIGAHTIMCMDDEGRLTKRKIVVR